MNCNKEIQEAQQNLSSISEFLKQANNLKNLYDDMVFKNRKIRKYEKSANDHGIADLEGIITNLVEQAEMTVQDFQLKLDKKISKSQKKEDIKEAPNSDQEMPPKQKKQKIMFSSKSKFDEIDLDS